MKGGSEAARSNESLASIWRETFRRFSGVPEDAINLLQTRADVLELLALHNDVDLIIPRGSKSLVEFVAKNSRIPVLGHGEGICHVYVDRAGTCRRPSRSPMTRRCNILLFATRRKRCWSMTLSHRNSCQ